MPSPRVLFLVPHDQPHDTLSQATEAMAAGADGVFLTPRVSGRARDLVHLAVTLQEQHPHHLVGVRRQGQATVTDAEEGFRRGVKAMWIPRGAPLRLVTPDSECNMAEGTRRQGQVWANLAFTPGHSGRARVRAHAMVQSGWVPVINGPELDAVCGRKALKDMPLFKDSPPTRLGWVIQASKTWSPFPSAVSDLLVAPPDKGWNQRWYHAVLDQAKSTPLGE